MASISSDEPPAVPGRQNPPQAPHYRHKTMAGEVFADGRRPRIEVGTGTLCLPGNYHPGGEELQRTAVGSVRLPIPSGGTGGKEPQLVRPQPPPLLGSLHWESLQHPYVQWVAYDRQFRQEALAGKSLDWSVPNHRLYQEAFTGRACNIPMCSYCVQDDHTSKLCTKNPARMCFCWPAVFPVWPAVQPPTFPTQGWPQPSPELCRRFNSGRCFAARCRYTHACTECGGGHPARDCPRARSGLPARARSPLRAHKVASNRPASTSPAGRCRAVLCKGQYLEVGYSGRNRTPAGQTDHRRLSRIACHYLRFLVILSCLPLYHFCIIIISGVVGSTTTMGIIYHDWCTSI